jgi:hypothetical protein
LLTLRCFNKVTERTATTTTGHVFVRHRCADITRLKGFTNGPGCTVETTAWSGRDQQMKSFGFSCQRRSRQQAAHKQQH